MTSTAKELAKHTAHSPSTKAALPGLGRSSHGMIKVVTIYCTVLYQSFRKRILGTAKEWDKVRHQLH